MKTLLITLLITAMNFQETQSVPAHSSEQMAMQVVNALQHSSVNDYLSLFPSLDDFHKIMQENRHVYGNFIHEAKNEFSSTYSNELLPNLIQSFTHVIQEGRKRGIDWSSIQYRRHEITAEPQESLSPVSFIITFSSQGKEYHLYIDKAFALYGEWKVSPSIKLL